MTDSVEISYFLDTTFREIGPTIVEYGSDRAFSYSDGIDSVFILGFCGNKKPIHIDSTKLREYLESGLTSFDSIKVLDHGR